MGVRRIYCNPTSGALLPRNLGSLAPGASTSIQLVGYIPSEVTSIRRWVNHGTVTVDGVTSTF